MAALANDGKDGLATFGPFSGAVEELIEMMGDMPDLGDKIKVEADVQTKLDAMFATIKSTSEILMSPQLMGVAAMGALVKLTGDFVGNAKDIRQELGLTVVQSAKIGFNITAAETSLTLMGVELVRLKTLLLLSLQNSEM